MKTLFIILSILAGAVMLIIAMYWLIELLENRRRIADNNQRIMDNEFIKQLNQKRYISTKKERL